MTLYGEGRRLPTYHVEASNIKDLNISSQQRTGSSTNLNNKLSTQKTVHLVHKQNLIVTDPQRGLQPLFSLHLISTQSFVDLFILSYSKPPLTARTASIDNRTTAKPIVVFPVMIPDSDKLFSVSPARPVREERKSPTARAPLTEPFNHMAINEKCLSDANDVHLKLSAGSELNGAPVLGANSN